MRLLSIDPGSKTLGWCIWQDDIPMWTGEIDCTKEKYTGRFQKIVEELTGLRYDYWFEEVCCEQAVRFKGKKIPELEVAVVAIRKWCKAEKLRCDFYNPATWKAAVAEDPRATKETVAAFVYAFYPNLPRDLSEHITDAIAIGHLHLSLRRLAEMASG